MIPYPEIDPIAFTLGPLFGVEIPLRWYGIAYVAGFFAAFYYLQHIVKKYPRTPEGHDVSQKPIDDLFIWAIIGVVLGGRLGYVLFYNFSYFMENPATILKTWQGGMSYHGGMLGVFLAVFLFGYRHKLNFFDLSDRLAPGICFGLLTGRLANFINGELFGRTTDVPWAMIFPHGGPLPRHPSQLYEAALEGILLFVILHGVLRMRLRRFEVSGLFMFFYGLFRSVVEFVREPDPLPHLQGGIFEWVTMGQVLSIPMMLVGLYLIYRSRRHECLQPA